MGPGAGMPGPGMAAIAAVPMVLFSLLYIAFAVYMIFLFKRLVEAVERISNKIKE